MQTWKAQRVQAVVSLALAVVVGVLAWWTADSPDPERATLASPSSPKSSMLVWPMRRSVSVSGP